MLVLVLIVAGGELMMIGVLPGQAGIIALPRPLAPGAARRRFYLPMAAATVVVISGLWLMQRLQR